MREKEGFFLTASLKQDRKSRGTLLALDGPGAEHRQFEIVSNGPADTLDLTYWMDGAQHVVSLEDVGLADSQWKNVTVQVTGETFSLYVGCDLIDSFTLDEPFYEQLKTEKSRMYVAKGSVRESHFRVRRTGTRRRQGPEGALGTAEGLGRLAVGQVRLTGTQPHVWCTQPLTPQMSQCTCAHICTHTCTHMAHTCTRSAHTFLNRDSAEQGVTVHLLTCANSHPLPD